MIEATITPLVSAMDANELDELLWRILWQPLGLQRDVRNEFKVDGESLELISKADGQVTGAVVAVWTGDAEIELRHIAVLTEFQKQGIGSRLVERVVQIAKPKGCRRIHTIARNTSVGFFKNNGFRKAKGIAPEHSVFKNHGIFFELMERIINPTSLENPL
jgi:N-acetylglutamate synthase-like GNAT family acetyltransferase